VGNFIDLLIDLAFRNNTTQNADSFLYCGLELIKRQALSPSLSKLEAGVTVGGAELESMEVWIWDDSGI
jgi:hypothetical protein